MNMHQHYEQLTAKEREFVDSFFDSRWLYELADKMGIPVASDDRIERAVDAFARAIIESRKEKVS